MLHATMVHSPKFISVSETSVSAFKNVLAVLDFFSVFIYTYINFVFCCLREKEAKIIPIFVV